jgi:hypothetical protein
MVEMKPKIETSFSSRRATVVEAAHRAMWKRHWMRRGDAYGQRMAIVERSSIALFLLAA